MRIALAQTNSTVGDIEGNSRLIVDWAMHARTLGAEIVVFPELAVSGYPPEDLLLKDHFLQDCGAALQSIAAQIRGIAAVVGLPLWEDGACYNAAAVVSGGGVVGWYRKIWLPNYGVFDEQRYFTAGGNVLVAELDGVKFAVTVCEDIWKENGPGEVGARTSGATVILNLSMSPYHRGKGEQRAAMLQKRAVGAEAYVCYVNGVGGQDELVFDGQSMVLDSRGKIVARARQFEEELVVVDVDPVGDFSPKQSDHEVTEPCSWPVEQVVVPSGAGSAGRHRMENLGSVADVLTPAAEVYQALCLGVRDYVRKNGFEQVVMGISGGIDSALTACVAADALGAQNLNLVSMPSRYSSDGTKTDAEEVARRLGANFRELAIEGLFCEYLSALASHLGQGAPGVTEQNIQARIRGNLLMAMSNKFGWLVLTTGNKSEMAVGYATLYGDMAGGFAVLKDVPKTLVYELADYKNSVSAGEGPIPVSTLTRAPSAELAPDQKDEDSLPPYDTLDLVIEAYVVNDESVEDMVQDGLERDVVLRVVGMIDGNEYKRRQSAPGVRITPKAFGKDRRLPITNRYRG